MVGVRTHIKRLSVPALMMLGLSLSACSQEQTSTTQANQKSVVDAAMLARINQLRAEVESAEDLSQIKKLQKAYGYYLDKGMWTDLSKLFTDDAVASYPAGVYEGIESITTHLYLNVGAVPLGEVGLGDGRLYNHINMQPVVNVDIGNNSARGRWRAMAMFGSFGAPSGIWAEGIYNMTYSQDENGVWKIKTLEYNDGFGDSYTTGWGANPEPQEGGGRMRQLPHPADRYEEGKCGGFPEACIAPFLYDNPGTSEDGSAWHSNEIVQNSAEVDAQEVAELLYRAQQFKDETELENLQRIYAYYFERALWDQVADLFSEEGTMEYAQMGVYQGKGRVREFLNLFGDPGLVDGWLFDHVQLQTIADVAPDGLSAKVRSREWGMIGKYQEEGSGRWHDGIYENTFVKEDGVWKIQAIHYYPTYITDYDKGWTQDAQPAPGMSEVLPPDAPPTVVYEIFPKAHVPAMHYPNPVTGEAPVYPEVGGPSAESIAATVLDSSPYTPEAVSDIRSAVSEAESLVQVVKDHHEIENLENAYGYYLDKNLWNDLADLFAENGSMELAQRGVYQGRERVRDFLFNVFGDEGPTEGRLGNHLHMQPVITVSEDGQYAQIRSRMMQQLSFGGRPSMGAAIYANEAVKEDGRWKFLSTHAFNTFTASYDGGWVKNPGMYVPGPSESFPPDTPPSVEFAMFPMVYDIPFYYDNPVSGRP